jgi:hypothetical protein
LATWRKKYHALFFLEEEVPRPLLPRGRSTTPLAPGKRNTPPFATWRKKYHALRFLEEKVLRLSLHEKRSAIPFSIQRKTYHYLLNLEEEVPRPDFTWGKKFHTLRYLKEEEVLGDLLDELLWDVLRVELGQEQEVGGAASRDIRLFHHLHNGQNLISMVWNWIWIGYGFKSVRKIVPTENMKKFHIGEFSFGLEASLRASTSFSAV